MQWLRKPVYWIVIESSSFHPTAKSDQRFQPLLFHNLLNKIAKHKSEWTKALPGKSKSSTNQHCFYNYTTSYFILQCVLFYNQLMSSKKQFSNLCKLYSINEEIAEELLDGPDVDSYFYHNIFDILQSHHRFVRVRKGSNKKSFAFKVFHFCDSKVTAAIFSQERSQHF